MGVCENALAGMHFHGTALMKKSRVTARLMAVLLSVLMVISTLTTGIYAGEMPPEQEAPAETPKEVLGGKLKLKGLAAVNEELSADLSRVEPTGLGGDSVTYLWERQDDYGRTERSREKTFKPSQEDLGHKLILTITGIAEKGYEGSLAVTSNPVEQTKEEAALWTEDGIKLTPVAEVVEEAVTEPAVPSESYQEPAYYTESYADGASYPESYKEPSAADWDYAGQQTDTWTDIFPADAPSADPSFLEENASSWENTDNSGNGWQEEIFIYNPEGTDSGENAAWQQETDSVPAPAYNEIAVWQDDTDAQTEPQDNTSWDTIFPDAWGQGNEDWGNNEGAGNPEDSTTWQEETFIYDPEGTGQEPVMTGNEGMGSEGQEPSFTGNESTGNAGTPEDNTFAEPQNPYQAQARPENGAAVMDFGTVDPRSQYAALRQNVIIKNTGTAPLYFQEIFPEHFMVQDFYEALQPGEEAARWIQPRESLTPGTYEDVITYQSYEGATASFTAKVVIQDLSLAPYNETEEKTSEEEMADWNAESPQNAEEIPVFEVMPAENGSASENQENTVPGENGENEAPAGEGDQGSEIALRTLETEPSEDPSSTEEPIPTTTPEPTKEPEPTAVPEPTEEPEPTVIPEPTEEPEPTAIPEPTEEPEPTTIPEPTEEPEPTTIPEPTEEPEPTAIPEPTEEPEPTVAPEPTEEPEPTTIPEPTEEPEPTDIPEPTEQPVPTDTPVPTETPLPTDTPVPTEEPTPTPEPVIALSASPESIDFGSLDETYATAPAPQTVTLVNTGNTILVLKEASATIFRTGLLSATVLAPGEKAVFNIEVPLYLAPGKYEEEILIFPDIAEENPAPLATVKASFTVTEVPKVWAMTAEPETIVFEAREEGTEKETLPQTITIKNTGNQPLHFEQPIGINFVVGPLTPIELLPGEEAAFTVVPLSNLQVGSYAENIEIRTKEGVSGQVSASFMVTNQVVRLLSIQEPEAVRGIENGSPKTTAGLKLPATVKLITTLGEAAANVTWRPEEAGYNPTSLAEQTFRVSGTVALPEAIKNPNNVNLNVQIVVTVSGRTPIIADPWNNVITGITSEAGVYTTESKITFYAYGAGTDNLDPKNGDVRYVPYKWNIAEDRTWDGAPYTATFRVGRSGEYTLRVTFNRQRYENGGWVNTGEQDTKSVYFSVRGPQTQNPSPTPGGRRAVLTEDPTEILPYIAILVIAILCILGIMIIRVRQRKHREDEEE